MTVEQIAKVAHEVNKAYCEAIGDYTQEPWDRAEDWQKQSAVDGVQFHLDNPNASPSKSHANWCEAKTADGWVWGPEKDSLLRHHPCLIEYENLPLEQRAKDFLFISVVTQLKGFLIGVVVMEGPPNETPAS